MLENGKRIDFSTERIKVSVTYPVVRLKKLSENEIFKMLNAGETETKFNSNLKRKSDISKTRMTRAKRQKLHHDPELISTVHSPNHLALNTCQPESRPVAEVTLCTSSKMNSPVDSTGVENIELSTSKTVSVIEFSMDEVVFAKIKGYPTWPAKIVGFENKRCEIQWFNDYRRSKVFRSQLFKFNDANVDKFSKAKKLGVETAIKEAIVYSLSRLR